MPNPAHSARASALAALAALVALLALCAAACHGDDRDRPAQLVAVPSSSAAPLDVVKRGTMTVTGTATLEVSPDCADLTMTLSVDQPRPGAAATGVQGKQKELVAAMRAAGVEAADLKLSELRLSPVYADSSNRDSTPKITAYRAAVTLTATTRKIDQIGALMETAATAGVTSMSSELRRSDMPELKKKVRDMALRAAREKAEQSARTLEIKLGRIFTVTEATMDPTWSQIYPNYASNGGSAVTSSGDSLGGALQKLTLEVTLEFDLPPS
jgi:uncharacterized protein YggE